MTALEIIGMILLLFLLLSLLRVGAIVDFGGELRVRLRVGPVKLTVLPRKEKKAQKKAAEAAGKTPEEKTKPKAAGGHRLPKLSFPELRELAGTVLGALMRTLRRTCRRTRIDPLEVGVIFAGDDPADTAQTYGYANAALWTLMPKLEELFYIPKPSVYLGMDFTKAETSAEGTVGVSLRVCDLFAILFTLAVPGGKMVPALAQGARGRGKSGAAGRARGCAGNERTGKTDCIERKIKMENKEKNSVSELMETTMTKIREMVDSNSVIGEPITTPDGVTLIPVSRVSLGFGSGGGTYGQTSERFGGGGGAGVKIDPVAFLVIKDGQTRMMPVAVPATATVDRVLEMAPQLIDRVEGFVNKKKEEKEFV